MHRIWTERTIPETIRPELERNLKLTGSGIETPDDPFKLARCAEAIIAGASIVYNHAVFEKFPDLKVISRTGIGIDNIEVSDATERNIVVCNTPDGPTISTAEMTITLMLNVAKMVKKYDRSIGIDPGQDFISNYNGIEVNGLTMGLVGLGRIGSRVALIGQALGMIVKAYDPFISEEQALKANIFRIDQLETLLADADVLSLHLPLTPETHRLMDKSRFALMKKGAIFINAARGGLVDETALLSAIDSGHLAGAGLDVYDPEPPKADNPILQRENIVTTPHLAGVTTAGKERMWRMAIQNIIEVLEGRKPDHIINPEVLQGA